MNLRQAVAQTQRRWLFFSTGKGEWVRCGFCQLCQEAAIRCSSCVVTKVLGTNCNQLPNYSEWEWYKYECGESDTNTKRAARLVLDDVNKIARHYHYPVREA